MKQNNLSYNISIFKILKEDIFKDAKDYIISRVKELGVQDSAIKSIYCYVPSDVIYLPSVSGAFGSLKRLEYYIDMIGNPQLNVYCGINGTRVKYSNLKIDDVIEIVEHLMNETK